MNKLIKRFTEKLEKNKDVFLVILIVIIISVGLILNRKNINNETDLLYKINDEIKKGGHGHILLSKYILQQNNNDKKSLIEIGSVREDISGQNSSEHFINLCKLLDMKFISIDIDKECSDNVVKLCKENNFNNYEIYTMKGEDYLKKIDIFDYIYLDGYDYDHGNHSMKRQDKYINILGKQINNEDSHNSHLEMVENISNKGSKNSLICIDDVISDNYGKGVKAVPYLLNNNWKILEKSNNSIIFSN